MNVLVVGAGVIGTVYGAHLGAAGHTVHVLSHPPRTDGIAAHGLVARDMLSGIGTKATARVVDHAGTDQYDLVLVTVRFGQITLASGQLTALGGTPTVLFFGVQRVTDMDGWLSYHAAFIACVAAALNRCGTDADRLSHDRDTLRLMCAAITEAFAALRREGTAGLPRNLGVLHSPHLTPVAERYWARTMRSPTGELCFAAHARNAPAEMKALAGQVTSRLAGSPATRHLRQLLVVEGQQHC